MCGCVLTVVSTVSTNIAFNALHALIFVSTVSPNKIPYSIHNCCDMGQNETIGKIELNPSFVLSSDNTNYKNDIQLFPQLFDELRVNGDCHLHLQAL